MTTADPAVTGHEASGKKAAEASEGHHLCVLIHGLWGQPSHLQYVADTLAATHADNDKLHILLAKTNAGNFTYDGIELGGERVAHEIEAELTSLEETNGAPVAKLSIVGYSLGGLVARYAIGLLAAGGTLDRCTPVNFTTFATPHLGTRSPAAGWRSDLFNSFGSRTLSASGRQLWAIDDFRDTGRPLLTLLADPAGVFMQALARFKHRSLYSNIVNDRSVPFFTSFIAATDPFADLAAVDISYVDGSDKVLLAADAADDTHLAVVPKTSDTDANGPSATLYESVAAAGSQVLQDAPFAIFMALFIPIGSVTYLVNSGVQSVRSAQRIKLHEQGKAGISSLAAYRLPALLQGMHQRAEAALEASQPQQTTAVDDENAEAVLAEKEADADAAVFPPLALSEHQRYMLTALNGELCRFQKYAVHIRTVRYTHAAIVARTSRATTPEGKFVVGHWVERFEV